MIEWIIEKSVKNRFLVMVFVAVVVAMGAWAMLNTPVDAIPDLSDVQVIVFTEYSGQSPQVVEDQVTYPLTTAMLSVPYAKTVRGYSRIATRGGSPSWTGARPLLRYTRPNVRERMSSCLWTRPGRAVRVRALQRGSWLEREWSTPSSRTTPQDTT